MRRYLVVANETLGGTHLIEYVRKRLDAGPCSFHVLVPATPPRGRWTYDESEARSIAHLRLDKALSTFRALGADVEGEVGDGRPLDAIRDAMRECAFDAILVSTLPPKTSRWLKTDLPNRARAEFGVPVDHVIGVGDAAGIDRGIGRIGQRWSASRGQS